VADRFYDERLGRAVDADQMLGKVRASRRGPAEDVGLLRCTCSLV
jgi:hypothetical protein